MHLIKHWGRWTPTKRSRNLGPHKDQGLEIIYVARGEIEWIYDGQPVRSKDRIQHFLKALEESCAEEWTLERMAEACELKRSRFTLLVSEITGDTPLRLLSRYRVELAKRLLREKSDSITQIGFDCGFNSSQYFARVFREFSGQTPGQWRRKGAHG